MFESQKQADPFDIHFESQNHYKHTHLKNLPQGLCLTSYSRSSPGGNTIALPKLHAFALRPQSPSYGATYLVCQEELLSIGPHLSALIPTKMCNLLRNLVTGSTQKLTLGTDCYTIKKGILDT